MKISITLAAFTLSTASVAAQNLTNTTNSTNTTSTTSSNTITLTDCDLLTSAANNWTLSQGCTNDLQGGSPPTLNAVYADISTRPTTTVYLYGLCGSTQCSADFTNFTSTYPSCVATSATSLRPWIQAYTNNCSTISASLGSSTCNVANYADYNWAKYQVQLTQQCASALNLTTSSLWYTAIQSMSLTNNTVTNAFCNTPDCISLTTGTTSQLGNCTVQSGENLFNTATNIVNYCNSLKASSTPTPTQATTPTPTTPTPAGTAATTSVPAATPTPTPTPTATKSTASTFATAFAAGLVAGFLAMIS